MCSIRQVWMYGYLFVHVLLLECCLSGNCSSLITSGYIVLIRTIVNATVARMNFLCEYCCPSLGQKDRYNIYNITKVKCILCPEE